MLQDFRHEDGRVHLPAEKLGPGVSIAIICSDALAFYREVTRAASRRRGRLSAIECGQRPFGILTAISSTSRARPICLRRPSTQKTFTGRVDTA